MYPLHRRLSYSYVPSANVFPTIQQPITSMAYLDYQFLLSGDALTLLNYDSMQEIKYSTSGTNFKYVICIDSSTCIAADDSTAELGIYVIDGSNFLGSGNVDPPKLYVALETGQARGLTIARGTR